MDAVTTGIGSNRRTPNDKDGGDMKIKFCCEELEKGFKHIPFLNNWRYCPYCGAKIEIQPKDSE